MEYSSIIGRGNEHIYENIEDLLEDVVYQIEIQGGLDTSDAQAILSMGSNTNKAINRFNSRDTTPKDARDLAEEILK